MSTIRFDDAVTALIAAYQGAAGLAGVDVYDGAETRIADTEDFIIVGHDGTTDAEGILQPASQAGTFTQSWLDFGGRQEAGVINCLIVSQTGESTDAAGRRARASALHAAAEDAALANGGRASPDLTFDGTTDGRFTYRRGLAGIAVLLAYRVSYSSPWS